VTLAFGQLIWTIVFKWHDFTGGDDRDPGISLISEIATANT
jgi:hypothetical protein